VSKTKFEERERGVFAVEEIRAMLANVSGLCATDKSTHDFTHPRPRADMLFYLLFLGGLRVGEARALRWRNVDLVQRRFSVVEAFKDVDGTVGAPKWDKKREGLAMPKLLAAAFRRWREYLVAQAGDEGNPFLQPDALVLSSADLDSVGVTWVRKTFNRILGHAERHPQVKLKPDERWLAPHSARHTLNTHLLASDVSALSVQQYLGWQSRAAEEITRVQDDYLNKHLLDTKKVADAIDHLYSSDQSGSVAHLRGA
jgi:integrase